MSSRSRGGEIKQNMTLYKNAGHIRLHGAKNSEISVTCEQPLTFTIKAQPIYSLDKAKFIMNLKKMYEFSMPPCH